jgi:hypothetical protein
MRIWALDALRIPHHRDICIRTAVSFRNTCCHTDREKYEALVDSLERLRGKESWLSLAIWGEIERIKNLHGGRKPGFGTFLAWHVDSATRRAA